MAITASSLIPNGAAERWHNGTGQLTYSILTSVPDYYPQIDTNGDGTKDAYMFFDQPPKPDSVPFNSSLASTNQILAQKAVTAWNDVARINLTQGTIGGSSSGVAITGNGTLVGGLGGSAGYGEITVPTNDDGSQNYSITSVFPNGLNFYGHNYTSIFVNTNGSITFGAGVSQYTPTSIVSGSVPMIAPFWADVDTRLGSPAYVDMDTTTHVLTVTWANVGYFDEHTSPSNSFQLQLYDRGNGNFDIVFRYQAINWTAGDASGGIGGLGGTAAHAGYTAGDGNPAHRFELPQSGNQAALLALPGTAGNTSPAANGLWEFSVRNGQVAVGDITFGSFSFADASDFGETSNVAGGLFTGTPGTADAHGDVWLNSGKPLQASAVYGDTGSQTYLHELGHALGLHHPNEDPYNNAGQSNNNNQYTVMSYKPHPSESAVADPARDYPITPMLLDIQAIQTLYGPNWSTRNNNTVYFGAGDTSGYRMLDDGFIASSPTHHMIMTIWDGGGNDTIDASNQTHSVNIDLNPAHFSTIGAIANNIAIADVVGAHADTAGENDYIENARGGTAADILTGNVVANVLDGGAGADKMTGGAGDDIYIVDNVGDLVIEALNEGNDIVHSTVNYTLGTNVESLILDGTAINGAGNSAANAIIGNSSNNIVDGKSGADYLVGGAGDDIYFIDNAGDVVVEKTNEGNDIVHASLDYTIGANIESLILDGATVNGAGNADNNAILGNDSNNILDGRGGLDYLVGGKGNDIYFVDNVGDTVVEALNEGNDIVHATIDYTIGINVESLVLDGTANLAGAGSSTNNALVGNSGNNVLDGRGGQDFLTGNGGNDTFAFKSGEAGGDLVADFFGNGTAVGDSFLFMGFGSVAQGAKFTEVGVTNQWQIHSGVDGHNEVITLQNSAAVHASDYLFV